MVSIPQGGMIRNSIEWEAYIAGEASWYIHTLYGKKDGEIFNIYLSSYTIYLNPTIGIHSHSVDITIPIDATPDIYDAWTVITVGVDINESSILAEKFDTGVLEVVPSIFASITSTNFTKI